MDTTFISKLSILEESAQIISDKIIPVEKNLYAVVKPRFGNDYADEYDFKACSCNGYCGGNFRYSGCSCNGYCGSNSRKD